MDWVSFAVRVEGVSPLILHKFTDAAAMEATAGTRSSTVGDRLSPQEEAESYLYTDRDGNPMIPQPNLFRCIMDGGQFIKIGKRQVTTKASSLVPSCVDIPEPCIPIEHDAPWVVDTRPVRIPSTGGRILRHRPMFHDWALNFSINLDPSVLSAKVLRQLVDFAGSRIGLCEFRPACKGPFGRFHVTSWVPSKERVLAETEEPVEVG